MKILNDKYLLINEMSNFNSNITWLDKTIIWIGKRPPNHGHRIKISNVDNKMTNDMFSLLIPSYKTKGDVKIPTQRLNEIIIFVKLNENIIKKYCDMIITYDEFIKKIKLL